MLEVTLHFTLRRWVLIDCGVQHQNDRRGMAAVDRYGCWVEKLITGG
jgi:hypothetical protein